MSVQVKIPPLLRQVTGRQGVLEVDATDVTECLGKMEERFPRIKSHLFDEKGELKSNIIINVNGKDMRSLSGLQTPVKSGDVVNILLAHPGIS
ncbi:MAG: MoaD/ThiS family protein [Pseudomonadota bacterium]